MEAITLKDLSPELRAQLLEEAKAEEKAQEDARKQNRKAYKELVNDMVPGLFRDLIEASNNLSKSKLKVYKAVEDAIRLKAEAFGIKEGQQSHTFSSEDGKQSIKIGFRVNDGWDDTAQTGIDKVNQFIAGISTDGDPEKKKMVNTIYRLLKKDSNGNLKSSRVLELQQIAAEWNNPLLNDAIEIISNAYKPTKSCYFIDAFFVDGTGKTQSLPLSISSVDFPNGTEINFL